MNARKTFYDVASFYKNKATLAASYQGMRYQVKQSGEAEEKVLSAVVWPEPLCFEKTPEEKKEGKSFPFTEEGLDEAYAWVCEQYESRREEWEHAKTVSLLECVEQGK